ncbi:hypothetical protein Hypma_013016 [Hypsizygus marmoreus]|uniref:Uncharacterized protein n=1 Tax=Hypsizygus marmoreus TaxID=39966 RepID=A0A369JCN9_HYPMA|nr:hypothetical protein Hypma_013016 [Hypsizygus marmoreus]
MVYFNKINYKSGIVFGVLELRDIVRTKRLQPATLLGIGPIVYTSSTLLEEAAIWLEDAPAVEKVFRLRDNPGIMAKLSS